MKIAYVNLKFNQIKTKVSFKAIKKKKLNTIHLIKEITKMIKLMIGMFLEEIKL